MKCYIVFLKTFFTLYVRGERAPYGYWQERSLWKVACLQDFKGCKPYSLSDRISGKGVDLVEADFFSPQQKIQISMGLLGLSSLSYAFSLCQSLSIKALFKCMIVWPGPGTQQRCSSPEALSQQALSLMTMLLAHKALAVTSDTGGPARLWSRIAAFGSVLDFVNWERRPNWSPAAACQGKERPRCLWAPSYASEAASPRHEAIPGSRKKLHWLCSASRLLRDPQLLGEWTLSFMCPWGIWVIGGVGFGINDRVNSLLPHLFFQQSVQFSQSVVSDSLWPHESQLIDNSFKMF